MHVPRRSSHDFVHSLGYEDEKDLQRWYRLRLHTFTLDGDSYIEMQ